MKRRTFAAGDGGFLYIDLIAGLTVLTLCLTVLFGAGRALRQSRIKENDARRESIERYEAVLEGDIEEIQL